MMNPCGRFESPPLNRNERFWTATVLAHLLADGRFAGLRGFLDLIRVACGNQPQIHNPDPDRIRFEAEYSLRNAEAPGRRAGIISQPAIRNDTPDILIWDYDLDGGFYCVEAKMFDYVRAAAIERQMGDQRRYVIEHLVAQYAVPNDRIFQVALVPEGHMVGWGKHGFPVITWEQVRDLFAPTRSSDYFFQVLSCALDAYAELVGLSEMRFHANADRMCTGSALEALGPRDRRPLWVGRRGGAQGKLFREDLVSGRWRSYPYEVRYNGTRPPNANWFAFEKFLEEVNRLPGE